MNRRTFLGNILTLAGAAIIKPPPIIFDMGANSKIYESPLFISSMNPLYEAAICEEYIVSSGSYSLYYLIDKATQGNCKNDLLYPRRFNHDSSGALIEVLPFLTK